MSDEKQNNPSSPTSEPDATPSVVLRPLTYPADGVPEVINTREALAAACTDLASGSGVIGVDTERAQSFRYTAKAYLVQMRRQGAGTLLIDPVAFEDENPRADLSGVLDAVGDAEWILHAATQDLPCLVEVGLRPKRLFDSELAGRLLNLPRVGLQPLLESAFGVQLLKEHSAADWSRRPLPEDWLVYAALDVEMLAELREWLMAQLAEAGKTDWAQQEFDYLLDWADTPNAPREEPWRRTSGIHQVNAPIALAVVRELWTERDKIAAGSDKAPSKILNDRAISELAGGITQQNIGSVTRGTLRGVDGFAWRNAARYESTWLQAVARVAAMPRSSWPAKTLANDMPQQPRSWQHRYPEAYARWMAVRPLVNDLAQGLDVPAENLLSPEPLRRLAWEPPATTDEASVSAFLAGYSVRPWQREAVSGPLAAAL